MKLLQLLAAFMLPLAINAQNVYAGNVSLTTQAQVNSFGNNQYTKVVGRLDIGASTGSTAITDLSPLSTIDTVTNRLQIYGNDSLKTLDGLHIKYVGNNLYLELNPKLENISALNTVKYIGNWLVVYRCHALRSLNGLNNVDSIKGDIYIGYYWSTPSQTNRGNNLLEDYCALTHTITTGGLLGSYYVANNIYNPMLSDYVSGHCADTVYHGNAQFGTQASLNAFSSNYTCITGKLQVFGPGIKNLTPLYNIDTVRGKLEILNTDSLETLNGLHVSFVGNNVYLDANASLNDISALASLTYIGNDLVILDCDSLQTLNGLQNVTTINGNIHVGIQGWLTPPVAKGNDWLTDFCSLTNLLTIGNGLAGSYNVANNAYNPVLNDFISGNCFITPLLVTDIELTVNYEYSTMELHWRTREEKKISYYEIERSIDGNVFEIIARVLPKYIYPENKDVVYSFVDKEPVFSDRFYRVKRVDVDNSFTYSNTISLKGHIEQPAIDVFPNPVVDNKIIVHINAGAETSYRIALYSITGTLVYETAIVHPGNDMFHPLALKNIQAKELYILWVTDIKTGTSYKKLIQIP